MSVVPAPRSRSSVDLAQPILFTLLGIGLGGVLIVSKGLLYNVQGAVSDVASLLPFGYAFGAGMIAAVNPCGIMLMPSLVAYYLGGDEAVDLTWAQRASKAFLFGLMATLGFIALFAVVGLLFAAGGRALGAYFPVGGLAIGILLAVLGLWMIATGHTLGLASASRAMGGVQVRNGLGSLFVFGIAYGVASLACTLPVFLVVVGTTLTVGGIFGAAGQFVSYALGMGSMLTAVIVAAAFFRGAVTRSIRRVLPYLHRLAASFLLGAGLFIIYYWLEGLRLIG